MSGLFQEATALPFAVEVARWNEQIARGGLSSAERRTLAGEMTQAIRSLRELLKTSKAALKQELQAIKASLRRSIEAVRAERKRYLALLKSQLDTDKSRAMAKIKELRASSAESSIKSEIKAIESLRASLKRKRMTKAEKAAYLARQEAASETDDSVEAYLAANVPESVSWWRQNKQKFRKAAKGKNRVGTVLAYLEKHPELIETIRKQTLERKIAEEQELAERLAQKVARMKLRKGARMTQQALRW